MGTISALAPFRLLFKKPFTTAHGTRDGTDSVFVRIEHEGRTGFGEATLPPYLKETSGSVEAALRSLGTFVWPDHLDHREAVVELGARLRHNAPARNAATMALLDLLAQKNGLPLWRMLELPPPPGTARCMVTVATSDPDLVEEHLRDLPQSDVLKVKLGSAADLDLVHRVKQLDARPLLLDGNQGIKSVKRALELIDAAGSSVIGFEQPFEAIDLQKHAELKRCTDVWIIGDESVQSVDDVRTGAGSFSAVNIKLMKCGGLERALVMAAECRKLGLGVMLGSMSESSLGCLAMYHLAGVADLVDLDGPWLIRNDPFDGLRILGDGPWTPDQPGLGASLKAVLDFTHIGV